MLWPPNKDSLLSPWFAHVQGKGLYCKNESFDYARYFIIIKYFAKFCPNVSVHGLTPIFNLEKCSNYWGMVSVIF